MNVDSATVTAAEAIFNEGLTVTMAGVDSVDMISGMKKCVADMTAMRLFTSGALIAESPDGESRYG
jgi:hypothetical protein